MPFYLRLQWFRAYPLSTRLPALILGLMGLFNLFWALIAANTPVVSSSPLLLPERGRIFNFLFGLAIIFIAGGLRRNKRSSCTLSLLALVGGCLYHLFSPSIQWIPVLTGMMFAGWLLITRRRYTTASNPAAVRNGLRLWLQAMVGVMLLGAVGLAPVGSGIENVFRGAARALAMFTLFYDPLPSTASGVEGFLSSLVYVTAAAAWANLLLALDSPMPALPTATAEERLSVLKIIREHGRTSLAHLTLLNDKRYFFTPRGSAIAYANCGRAALTLGDPIGPSDDAVEAIAAFSAFCAEKDWIPAFCLTSADYLAHYRSMGFKYLCMGHEGIIHLPTFTLKGNANRTIRKRYNRLSASGYRVEIYEPPINDELLAELRLVSDEWLKMAMAAEKRFFLAWFDEGYVRGERIAVVRSPEGMICAFTNLVPEYQLNEISIDLMRRRKQIESGTMDFLFVSLFLWAREQGYDSFNLGLSPLFGVGEGPEASLLEQAIRYMYHHGNFYDFKGLNGFKIKFRPVWTPQYLVYPGLLELGWVGLAMARVNAGENETLWDYFRSRPKHIELGDPSDLARLVSETQGD